MGRVQRRGRMLRAFRVVHKGWDGDEIVATDERGPLGFAILEQAEAAAIHLTRFGVNPRHLYIVEEDAQGQRIGLRPFDD